MFSIDRNLFVILLLIFYVSSIYRMAILIVTDDGPLKVFDIIRRFPEKWIFKGERRLDEDDFEEKDKEYYKWYVWNSFYDGINCTDCVGVWSAIILGAIFVLSLYWDYTSILIFILGGAGIQHYITNRNNGEDEFIT